MKIGIYKAGGKKICFKADNTDHSAISIEITRIIRIMADHGHDVFILSDTDYIPNSIKHVSASVPVSLDKIFIYNGPGLRYADIQNFWPMSLEVNLIVTDLSLLPTAEDCPLSVFTHVYTQSMLFSEYGAIQEHECYQYKPKKYKKTQEIYFGGTERGRSKDFFEYVYRPNIKWFGKSDTLGIRNYIPYHKHIEEMKKSKYSIVIGDESYNNVGFVTPRYYECIRYGVIPFVDYKYDPDELMISKESFLRVHDYKEMIEKIKMLDYYSDGEALLSDLQDDMSWKSLTSGSNIMRHLKLL